LVLKQTGALNGAPIIFEEMTTHEHKTYEDYAIEAGIPVLKVKQAVKRLFDEYRRQAIRHEPKGGGARLYHNIEKCGYRTGSGRPCSYKAQYDDGTGTGNLVCGLHRPDSYNMGNKTH